MENSETLKIYKEFDRESPADILCQLLDEENIPFQRNDKLIENETAYNMRNPVYQVLVPEELHEQVDQLVESRANAELDAVDKDYFIFGFNEEELKDVVVNAHEWSPLDIALALKLLKEKGIDLDPDQVKEERSKVVEESSKPEVVKGSIIGVWYVLAIFTGVVATIFGLLYATSKKENSIGERVHKYDANTRRHGRIIAALGVFFTCVWILVLS